jgi:signal transduction histidine kinase
MISTFIQSLGARITLALVIIFILFGISSAILFIKSNERYEKEVTQTIHHNLAQHVVDNYLLFRDGKPDYEAAKQSFHDLMILGANFEFYLLDKTGRIVAFDSEPDLLSKKTIDLEPIKHFVSAENSESLILGDDPKNPKKRKVFSAAPIFQMGEVYGYLYVVVGSQARDKIEAGILNETLLRSGLDLFILLVSLMSVLTFIIVGLITKPLKKLTKQVTYIQSKGFEEYPAAPSEAVNSDDAALLNIWDESSSNDIHILGATFQKAMEKLEAQYRHIVSIDELRKELLSHLSHDLRTPLASLLGYLETWEMQKDTLSPDQSKHYIATARKNAQKIVVLIEQLFDLAHLDSDSVTVKKERVSVAELVHDVLQKFALSAEEKHIQLDVEPKDSSIVVYADIEKLERVFVNLIENALRHTSDHGRITVNLKRNASLVSVEVSDTGIGIPEQDLPFIFDPHFKAGNSVRENTAHGGLGLAITKRLLELHQAEINVRSALHKGTTFSFSLSSA